MSNFLIVGFERTGSTTLSRNLGKHPNILMKEESLNFFDNNNNYDLGKDKYDANFITTDINKNMKGENGNRYCLTDISRKRIYDYNPKMKLIFILREPVSRAFSQYTYYCNKGFQGTFEVWCQQSLDKIKKNTYKDEYLSLDLLTSSLYVEHITGILKYFPKEQIHFIISENMLNNLDFELQRAFKFLGVDTFHDKWENDLNKNKYTTLMNVKTKKAIYNVILPSIEALYKMINMRIKQWEPIDEEKELTIQKQSQGISITPNSITMLKEKKILIDV